jgi:SprT-like family
MVLVGRFGRIGLRTRRSFGRTIENRELIMADRGRKPAQRRRPYKRAEDKPVAITPIEYSGLQEGYDHFNAALFDAALPDVFITYQRKAHSFGYFSPDRFSGRIGKRGKHELALNPDGFIGQTDEQVCQTLVHEMVHVWQHAFGAPSKRGYHNKEWAAKMKQVGLQPSSTGMVGGKETGQKMLDYVIPSGPFTEAFAKLAAIGWRLNLQSAHRPGPKVGTNSKTKFTCIGCGQNAWGKPDLAIACIPCGTRMLPDVPTPAPTGSYEQAA